MDKVTQINVEGHVYELLAGQAVAGTSSAAAASYVKVVVFEDAVSLISGMMLAVKFANENTAGFSGNKTVYSSDGETFYYDQAMTDLVTLPPVGCYEITLISGEEYSFSAFPVLSVNGVEKPFCNSRGYPTGGDVWKAGDTVTVVYVDDKFIDVSSAVGSGSGITVYPTEQALNEDLPNVEDGALVSYPGDGDGLNDAPLGSTMSYLGNTDPSDGKWLICDGRDTTGTAIELETHYPSLYMFLGATNVLPEIFDHSRPSAWETKTISTNSVSPTVMDYDGILFIQASRSGSSVGCRVELFINGTSYKSNIDASSYNIWTAFVTAPVKKGDSVYYTYMGDTLDKCGGWFYKSHKIIKAVSSVDYYHAPASEITQIEQYFDNGINTIKNNGLSYSTEEVWTGGYWIDGKKIYRMCNYATGSVTVTATGSGTIPLSWFNTNVKSDVDTILKVETGQSGKGLISIWKNPTINTTGVNVTSQGGQGYGISTTTVIVLEYTKTTD